MLAALKTSSNNFVARSGPVLSNRHCQSPSGNLKVHSMTQFKPIFPFWRQCETETVDGLILLVIVHVDGGSGADRNGREYDIGGPVPGVRGADTADSFAELEDGRCGCGGEVGAGGDCDV